MTDILKRIEEISRQLEELQQRHLQATNEIIVLRNQLAALEKSLSSTVENKINEPVIPPTQLPDPTTYLHQVQAQLQQHKEEKRKSTFHVTHELENFIGTNLISKIGIVITIIGVFVGAKYAIDKELISPLMRIILSYVFAGALCFVALRLKPQYESFSSILMGGALAVAYFITYIAFSFYHLFPQGAAFVLMIVTTVAAVAAALWYQQKVIALLGQVAAYAIPFLLSNGSGNTAVLFAYISIINIGLLVLSFKQDWKILYRIAFFITWLIYAALILGSSRVSSKLSTGLLFIAINFATFYITFLAYKILKKQLYRVTDITVLLLNALLFFFLGAYIIQENFGWHRMLTWFTLANALIHFVAGLYFYKRKLADTTVFQFILGLALLFVTITIPIKFDGNWVTLLWTVEATTLFYIAYANKRKLYLDIALPLVMIALLSLLQDWGYAYSGSQGGLLSLPTTQAFANLNFWLSLIVCACFGYMSYKAEHVSSNNVGINTNTFFNKALPVIFIALLYFTFYNELHLLWDKVIEHNLHAGNYVLLQTITLLIYSCVFVAALLWLNAVWIKRADISTLLLTAAAIVNLAMIFKGLYVLGELRENYIQQQLTSSPSQWLILVRYCCVIALAILWLSAWNTLRIFKISSLLKVLVSMLFNFTLLSIICNEFIHVMDLAGYSNQYKLGLSIICGVYALALVFTGIIKRRKHLRIGGMFLFGTTLLKLFFYDLSSLSTISKTIVLLLLGILLLVSSFLYNKYKDLLFTKEE